MTLSKKLIFTIENEIGEFVAPLVHMLRETRLESKVYVICNQKLVIVQLEK